jgi:diguanylate cyclase
MAERQLPKLHTRVRFPSPAPHNPSPRFVNNAFQIVCAACPVPAGLAASAFGPFECHSLATLAELDTDPNAGTADAVLIGSDTLAELARWPSLAAFALNAAVVVVSAKLLPEAVMQLLQSGVQDVLRSVDADATHLGPVLRMAIERKQHEIAARKAYATDLSTGLPNHPLLLEHMTHLLALREREPAPMALIVLRVQGLAQTEAVLGAESANVLRRKAAVRLRSGLRASDVVASIGADAFAVLLAWIDSPQDGERVTAKLAQSLAQPFLVAGREQTLAISAGLSSYPEHGKAADMLLRRALAQAGSVATVGVAGQASAADRGPGAAANDED